MLVKNRKTGVVMKATPRLVAMAVRNAHFDLIEDEDYIDLEEVKALLKNEKGADDILKDLQALVTEKIESRSRLKRADADGKGDNKAKAPAATKTKAKEKSKAKEPEKQAEKEPGKESGKDPGTGDDFIELEAMVQALQGGEKDKDHKDRLEAAALETFGVNLDKRKSLAALKQEVLDLIAEHRGQ